MTVWFECLTMAIACHPERRRRVCHFEILERQSVDSYHYYFFWRAELTSARAPFELGLGDNWLVKYANNPGLCFSPDLSRYHKYALAPYIGVFKPGLALQLIAVLGSSPFIGTKSPWIFYSLPLYYIRSMVHSCRVNQSIFPVKFLFVTVANKPLLYQYSVPERALCRF